MPLKIFQINVVSSQGSTGRIVHDLKQKIVQKGWECFVAYGRTNSTSENEIQIGRRSDQAVALLRTRIFDDHGFASRHATDQFIEELQRIKPDIIHLHNLHGYYINIESLFGFLKSYGKPVVWTLHDCWAFTGHCTYFTHIKCEKWQSECYECPLKKKYPASFFKDGSKRNFKRKKELFTSLPNLTLITVSDWLRSLLPDSFLKDQPSLTAYNGIDLSIFSPVRTNTRGEKQESQYILGVANIWTARKGLDDFLQLRKILNSNIEIVLVGLSKKQIESLPAGMQGITRLNDVKNLADLYANALAFVNPSILETFGMVTAEALACGTPVVVYDATASPELVKPGTGYVVPQHDIAALAAAVDKIEADGKAAYTNRCREVATELFNKDIQYQKYLDLYKSLSEK